MPSGAGGTSDSLPGVGGTDPTPGGASSDARLTALAGQRKNLERNIANGNRREAEAGVELADIYPVLDGYTIYTQVTLRDENGKKALDPVTGKGRRVDYVVDRHGKIIDSIEVTSHTANKNEQSTREERIRDNGGNYIRTQDGILIRIPGRVRTRIDRRD